MIALVIVLVACAATQMWRRATARPRWEFVLDPRTRPACAPATADDLYEMMCRLERETMERMAYGDLGPQVCAYGKPNPIMADPRLMEMMWRADQARERAIEGLMR